MGAAPASGLSIAACCRRALLSPRSLPPEAALRVPALLLTGWTVVAVAIASDAGAIWLSGATVFIKLTGMFKAIFRPFSIWNTHHPQANSGITLTKVLNSV
jgi:hypothetical protein